jgi:hypothetical protein
MKKAHPPRHFVGFSKHMPAYVRALHVYRRSKARPSRVQLLFFVDRCPSVRAAYDTRVDALVDTRIGPAYPANTSLDLESTLCAGNCLVFFFFFFVEENRKRNSGKLWQGKITGGVGNRRPVGSVIKDGSSG